MTPEFRFCKVSRDINSSSYAGEKVAVKLAIEAMYANCLMCLFLLIALSLIMYIKFILYIEFIPQTMVDSYCQSKGKSAIEQQKS